jgi:3-methyl-2-oxobutanoate hydroxymethyltransferase
MVPKKITTHILQNMKANGERISMITAYDFSFGRLFDQAGIDVILVGDSASNVMAGHETTLPITLDQMIYHASSVIRGVTRSLVIVDLPFGSYQSNSKEALISAIRIMKETGAHGVKLEGGEEVLESVKRILAAGVPVMGHLGLTPQSIYKFGTYSVRAKEEMEAKKLKADARLLAKEVAENLNIPVIGIGAGKYCDGQVLVMHDLLGINTEFKPRFLRQYLNLHEPVTQAVQRYIQDVKSNDFPSEQEQY